MDENLLNHVLEMFTNGSKEVLKKILGKTFDKLSEKFHTKENDEFKLILETLVDIDENVKTDLEAHKNGTYIPQNHSGNGDNVAGNKTVNNYNNRNNSINYKNHPLYKNSLFLDDIELSNKDLSEEYYHNVDLLLIQIKDDSYEKAIEKLLPTVGNRLLLAYNSLADTDIEVSDESLKSNREKIISNREEIKNLVLMYLQQNHK